MSGDRTTAISLDESLVSDAGSAWLVLGLDSGADDKQTESALLYRC